MKPIDLHSLWAAPDNSRLTAKQVSMRFPVHVAAKLSALCELYPNKTRTQIVGDLLAQALLVCEASLPAEQMLGEFVDEFHDAAEGHLKIYRDNSLLSRYRTAANEHYRQLELELGNTTAGELFATNTEVGGERFFGVTVDVPDTGAA